MKLWWLLIIFGLCGCAAKFQAVIDKDGVMTIISSGTKEYFKIDVANKVITYDNRKQDAAATLLDKINVIAATAAPAAQQLVK